MPSFDVNAEDKRKNDYPLRIEIKMFFLVVVH